MEEGIPSGKVLSVDDDPDFRALVRHHLEAAEYRVFELPDGSQAADVAVAENVQIVLLDIVMPGTEGLETITQLRRAGCRSLIVAISGAGKADQYMKMARLLGAHACWEKSEPIEALLSRLAELAGGPGGSARGH